MNGFPEEKKMYFCTKIGDAATRECFHSIWILGFLVPLSDAAKYGTLFFMNHSVWALSLQGRDESSPMLR